MDLDSTAFGPRSIPKGLSLRSRIGRPVSSAANHGVSAKVSISFLGYQKAVSTRARLTVTPVNKTDAPDEASVYSGQDEQWNTDTVFENRWSIERLLHAARGPALRSVHTKHSQKAGPFSVARLKMDLPFHDRLRVHKRSASPLHAATTMRSIYRDS